MQSKSEQQVFSLAAAALFCVITVSSRAPTQFSKVVTRTEVQPLVSIVLEGKAKEEEEGGDAGISPRTEFGVPLDPPPIWDRVTSPWHRDAEYECLG